MRVYERTKSTGGGGEGRWEGKADNKFNVEDEIREFLSPSL